MLSPQSLENYRSSGQCPPPTTTNFSITVVQNVFCFAWWHVPVQQMLRRIVGQHIALGWPQKSSRNSPSATVGRGRVSIEAMGSNQKHKETNDKQKCNGNLGSLVRCSPADLFFSALCFKGKPKGLRYMNMNHAT